VKIDVRDARPVVEGVYVNGHGPYRFLVDNVDLMDADRDVLLKMSGFKKEAAQSRPEA
jgi:hypothetical protein